MNRYSIKIICHGKMTPHANVHLSDLVVTHFCSLQEPNWSIRDCTQTSNENTQSHNTEANVTGTTSMELSPIVTSCNLAVYPLESVSLLVHDVGIHGSRYSS